MTVTSEQAMKTAQDFLGVVYPGTEADEIVSSHIYHAIMTTLEGGHYGMLGVNGFLWLGGLAKTRDLKEVRYEVHLAGIAHRINGSGCRLHFSPCTIRN